MSFTNIAVSPRKFFPQLEGLRAFAIAFIIISHWNKGGPVFAYWMEWAGIWGVTYFFVLSGFLIGNIVLAERENLPEVNSSLTRKSLGNFYVRRMLRTLPAYYLLLIILIFLQFPYSIASISPWFFLNASNLYFFFYDCWNGSNTYIGHFWTLAIEEQFYLIFPLLILFIPKRFAFRAIILMGIAGIVCRLALYFLKYEYFRIFTLSSFDAFALGAVLSYLKMKNISVPYIKALILVSLVLYVFLPTHSIVYFTGKSFLNWLIPSAALSCAGIIYIASQTGINGGKWLLENKFVLFIGKIGYGLYLYHMFIPFLTTYFFNLIGYSITNLPIVFFINTSVLLITSSASYYFLEKPIYSLKKYFQYTSTDNALKV